MSASVLGSLKVFASGGGICLYNLRKGCYFSVQNVRPQRYHRPSTPSPFSCREHQVLPRASLSLRVHRAWQVSAHGWQKGHELAVHPKEKLG